MEMQESNIVKVFGRKCWIVCSLFVFVACNAPIRSVPYYLTPDLSPVWSSDSINAQSHTINAFSFTNQNNELFGSNQLAGKIYVANFFFTACPSICPKMTNNLSKVAEHFKSNQHIEIISFSVTPDMDSVPVLRNYHKLHNLGKKWHLLTGDQSEIYTLARQSYFVEERFGLNATSEEFLHTERCVLIDRNGYIRGVYNATLSLDMERIIDDINALLTE